MLMLYFPIQLNQFSRFNFAPCTLELVIPHSFAFHMQFIFLPSPFLLLK